MKDIRLIETTDWTLKKHYTIQRRFNILGIKFWRNLYGFKDKGNTTKCVWFSLVNDFPITFERQEDAMKYYQFVLDIENGNMSTKIVEGNMYS